MSSNIDSQQLTSDRNALPSKSFRVRVLFFFLLIGIFSLSGCGVYTFDPKGKSDIQHIAVEPFSNETTQFGLVDRLTEIIIDALIADGNMKVVGTGSADALLVGKLLTYRRVPESFDENDQVQTYKIIMDFEVSLKKPSDDSIIWTQKTTQEGVYDANTETEEDGQRRAGERLVEIVINKTTKSW